MRTILVLLFISIVAIAVLIPLILISWIFRFPQIIIFGGRFAILICQKIAGIQLEVHGLEKIKKKTSYLFMSNHMSIVDGPLLFRLIPISVRVLPKKEVFRIPILGLAMKQIGFVPVDRRGLKGGKKSIDMATRLMKEKKFSFLIFPEGTRSRDGSLQSFKRGGFFLAVNSQVPIIPISLKGTFEILPKKSFFMKKGKIRIIFHDPVQVSGYTKKTLTDLSNKIHGIIQFGLE